MRFYNETQWDTAQLKALCKVVIEKMGAQGVVRSIRFIHRRCDAPSKINHMRYGGTAQYKMMHITIKLPKCSIRCETVGENGKREWFDNRTIFSPTVFAQILEHEVTHLLGVRSHKEMQKWWTLDTSYAHGYNVQDSREIKSEENKTGGLID